MGNYLKEVQISVLRQEALSIGKVKFQYSGLVCRKDVKFAVYRTMGRCVEKPWGYHGEWSPRDV